MSRGQTLLIFLSGLGMSLLSPVLSLVLFAHGGTLTTLGIALAVYSATVLLLEVPSGVLSDLWGRKQVYYLSCGIKLCSLLLLFLSRSLWTLLFAMALWGMARAFSTGTIYAAILDLAMKEGGEPALNRVTARLSVWQCAGTAAGALLGGLLPAFSGYAVHLYVSAGLTLICAGLTAVLLPREDRVDHVRVTLKEHLQQSCALLRHSRPLPLLLLGTASSGVLLMSVETYWQPALLALPTPGWQSLLGAVCTLGFGLTILGSWIMGRFSLSSSRSRWSAYLLMLLSLSGALILLSFQPGWLRFSAVYALFYLLAGALSVPEQIILNSAVPSSQRASMISLDSLVLQLGALIYSAISSILLHSHTIAQVWQLGAAVPVIVVLVCGMVLLKHKNARA